MQRPPPGGRRPAQAAVRQVRVVAACRPPVPNDSRRLSLAGGAAPLAELDFRQPSPPPSPGGAAPADAAEGLLRDVVLPAGSGAGPAAGGASQGTSGGASGGAVFRLPVYGYLGGGDGRLLCEREVGPLVERLQAGESAAVLAFGQTGTGKSYTLGTEKLEEGQAPQPHSVGAYCARRVFELARAEGVRDLEVSFAAIEIYREGSSKERLFDLLTLDRRRIDSVEQQATWQLATGPDDLHRKLLSAAFLRNTDRTDGNARSSRSHAIFITQIRFQRQLAGGGAQRVRARLMLVDLAGSERASLAGAGSEKQRQGSGINVGLLYLGNCIRDLAEKGSTLQYRNSALTELLRPALGGGGNEVTSGCNTLIVGCISPLALHAANTRSTLEFLEQAGTVRNEVLANVQQLRQQELEAQVEHLQRRVQELLLGQQQARQAQQVQQEAAPGDGEAAAAAAAAAALAAAEDRAAALERELAGARRELVEQRDRADAFEQALRLQAEAEEAAADAGGEAAAATPAGPGATPLGGGRPSAAFLAASPLLSASRGVAEWASDAAQAEAATPAGQRLQLLALLPGAAELCCAGESHMRADELAMLQDKVRRKLGEAEQGDERAQAKAFAEAALYAVGAYNAALGAALTAAEEATEDAAAEAAQHAAEFGQLYAEKREYMLRTSAAEGGLARYEGQIEQLKAELAAAQEALQHAQQQGTPGRWASLGRLIAGSGGGAESRRTSHSGSPQSSPRASLTGGAGHPLPQPQQLFGSPSRLGALHGQAGGGGGARGGPGGAEAEGGRRATIACVRRLSSEQERSAAVSAALASKQLRRKSAVAALPCADAEGSLIKAALPSPAAAAAAAAAAAEPEQQAAAQQPLKRRPEEQWQEQQSDEQQPEQQAAEPMAVSPLLHAALKEEPQAAGPSPQPHRLPSEQLEAMADSPLPAAAGSPLPMADSPLPQSRLPLPQSPQPRLASADLQPAGHAGEQPQQQPQQAEAGGEPAASVGGPAAARSPAAGNEARQPAASGTPAAAATSGGAAAVKQEPGASPPPAAAAGNEQQQQQQQQQQQAAAPPAGSPALHDHQPEQAAAPSPAASPAPEQQQQRQQQPSPEPEPAAAQQQQQLPGPRISVQVPVAGRRGARQAALQAYEWEPANGRFFEADDPQQPADPLRHMTLRRGEPWQRRVLLAGSGVSLEAWQHRRMLVPGRCHFCASAAPDPACRHPEAKLAALQLCGGCHAKLEPEVWKSDEVWKSEDPEDPGYTYCCCCGGAGVGCTDRLIMCSTCRVNGFCTGCLWRFTSDDLAAAERPDAAWECLLCRPDPLHLEYAEPEPTSSGSSGDGGSRARSRARSRAASYMPEAAGEAAATTGLRRSTRARRPPSRQAQQAQQQVPATPGDEFYIDLCRSSSDSSSSSSDSGSSDGEEEPAAVPSSSSEDHSSGDEARRRRPAAGRRSAGGKKAAAARTAGGAGGRKPPARAAAAAAAADDYSQPTATQRPGKRRLGPNRDIAESPGEGGEVPAHVHQRQRQGPGMRPGLQRAMDGQRAGLQAKQHRGADWAALMRL